MRFDELQSDIDPGGDTLRTYTGAAKRAARRHVCTLFAPTLLGERQTAQ